ncbi:hypothetical protein [Thalassotalea euphylliae]|uniref:Lipoprotein n=1 Tax=Thalassotalea euphylliae TaxID=1655234 RepID=A0A3E0U6T8_9GAMM|nr:hypothetical protein [Thalassotalea euphylliae]REL31855.1 hypothetical protein DXX94_14640 [Thalassotalea euphylliae]
MKAVKVIVKQMVLGVLAMVTAGCSTPTVHLYGRYLTEEQQTNVIQQLQSNLGDKSFNISVNQHQFPESINDTTIIYSPFISDPAIVHLLANELSNLDWQVTRTSALKEGNHWFQKNSIGVFLVPNRVNPHAGTLMRDMANLYRIEHNPSEDAPSEHDHVEYEKGEHGKSEQPRAARCETPLTLSLTLEGRYSFSEEVKTENYSYGTSGQWRMRAYPFIEMRPDTGGRWLYFEAQQESRHDQISQLHVTKLTPIEDYANLAGCQFVYGQRS